MRRGGGNGGRERMRRLTRADVEVRLTAPVGEGDLLELRPVDDPTQFLTAPAPADAAAGEDRHLPRGAPHARGLRRAPHPLAAGARRGGPRGGQGRGAPPSGARPRDGAPRRALLGGALVRGTAPPPARAEGFVVEAARTREVTGEELVEHGGRMGQSPFEPVEWDVTLDSGCGMSFSSVHKVRAEACRRLEEALLAAVRGQGGVQGGQPRLHARSGACGSDCPPCAPVRLRARDHAGMRRGGARRRRHARLRGRGRPRRGRVARGASFPGSTRSAARATTRASTAGCAAGEPVAVGSVLRARARRGARRAGRGPLLHPGAQRVLPRGPGGRGARRGVWLSPELTLDEVCALARAARVPAGLSVLGPRARDDEREHCVLQALGSAGAPTTAGRCALRRRRLSLRDIDGRELPVRTDVNGPARAIWFGPVARRHAAGGRPSRRRRVASSGGRPAHGRGGGSRPAVRRVVRAVEAAQDGRRPDRRLPGATSGHLFAGIG